MISWPKVRPHLMNVRLLSKLLGNVDGLTRIFATIKVTSNVNDLPSEYLDVLEWARVS